MLKSVHLNEMIKGWFVGNFEPSLIKTTEVEVGVKNYLKGDKEETHYHKVATEITVIISGQVIMNGKCYSSGDIVIVEPYVATNFEALENTITTVVKIPGANNDKFEGVPSD